VFIIGENAIEVNVLYRLQDSKKDADILNYDKKDNAFLRNGEYNWLHREAIAQPKSNNKIEGDCHELHYRSS
jgi:hypothetical protein